MKKSLNILIATDYSKFAENAERYAIRFAQSTQSSLLFTHVFEPSLAGTNMSFDAEKIDYSPLKYHHDKLNKHVSKLLEGMGIDHTQVEYRCTVREGNSVKEQIGQEAIESKIDLIIAGTHSATLVREWIFGSHTWDIIKHSRIPVLAIPEQVEFSNIKRIVFATEYREGEIPAIHYLTQIAQGFDAGVTVLHIASDMFSTEFENTFYAQFKGDVSNHIAYNKLNIEFIQHDNIIDGLNEYCMEHHINWLVMSPERAGLFEKVTNPASSMTRHMSFHTKVPLLALPDFYNMAYGDGIKLV